MKKTLICTIVVLFLIFSLSLSVCASDDVADELSNRLFSELDGEFIDVLEDFGIMEIDSQSIYDISAQSIFTYFKDEFNDYFKNTMALFVKISALIIITGTLSMICDEKKYKEMLVLLMVPVVIIILTDEINLCISSALSLLKLNGNFLLAFVPVYAVAIAVSGNPGTALTYNTLVLGFGEAVSAVFNYYFVDVVGCVLALSIGFTFNDSINFSRFLSAANRLVTFTIGIISSVFGAVLTVKSIFSVSTDSVISKGIRFAIGSLIPVIGSSISDAYSTLVGSLGLIRNSVAVIGILAVLLVNLPVIVEIFLFNASLNTLSFISDMLDCGGLSDILKAFAFGVKIIGVMVIFEFFILIISTAVILTVRGG